jgi:hypothetical protein
MTSRLAVAALVVASALVFLPAVSAQPAGDGAKPDIGNLPLGKDAWDLRALDGDPVRLVKVTYDEDRRVVRIILEFRRDLTVRDTDWRGLAVRPPYWFRFQDAEGTTLRSEEAQFGSEVVGLQGRRVRLVLPWPAGVLPALTKKVVVDHRPYGE